MPEISRSQLVAYAAFAILVLAIGVRFMRGQQPAPAPPARPVPAAARGGGASGDGVSVSRPPATGAVVHVAGAVGEPGVYRLPAGARVQDAVARAGGAKSSGDVNAINLAAKVVDGQQIVVPAKVRGGAARAAVASGDAGVAGAAPGAPVSLNSATAEQLDTLDGVGPATAQKIIAWRTQHGGFRSVADLGQVPGIGPKKLAALKDKVQP